MMVLHHQGNLNVFRNQDSLFSLIQTILGPRFSPLKSTDEIKWCLFFQGKEKQRLNVSEITYPLPISPLNFFQIRHDHRLKEPLSYTLCTEKSLNKMFINTLSEKRSSILFCSTSETGVHRLWKFTFSDSSYLFPVLISWGNQRTIELFERLYFGSSPTNK